MQRREVRTALQRGGHAAAGLVVHPEGGLDPGQAVALASGSLLMGAVALLAVVAGVVSLRRARRYPLDALDAEA